MNRNTIIGLVLIFAIFIGWSYWMQPSEEELEAQRQEQIAAQKELRINDSIKAVKRAEQQAAILQQQAVAAETIPATIADSSSQYKSLSNKYGAFGLSGEGTDEFITIESDLLKLTFSTKGGRVYSVELKNYETFDSIPLILFNSDSARFGYSFYSKGIGFDRQLLLLGMLCHCPPG